MLHECQLREMQDIVVNLLEKNEEVPIPLLLIHFAMVLAKDIPATASVVTMSMVTGKLIEDTGEGTFRRGEMFDRAAERSSDERNKEQEERDRAEVDAFLSSLDGNTDFNTKGLN